jgi:hypothetical protein
MISMRLIAAAIILASVTPSGCVKEKKAEVPVTVMNKVGKVSLNSPGNALPIDAALHAGDRILTGEKSMVTLLFPENSAVRIYEKTEFTISGMGPAGTAGAGDTEFAANKGRAMLVIAKLSKSVSLRVKTPTAVASVRGTSFVVAVDDAAKKGAGASTDVKVLSGSVYVEANDRPQINSLVQAGEMVSVAGDSTDAEATAIPEKTLKELMAEKTDVGEMSGISQEPESKQEVKPDKKEKQAPVLKTERAIKEYYHKLEEVELDDGTTLIGAVIYQNTAVAKVHTPHGIVQVPTRSIKTIRMR